MTAPATDQATAPACPKCGGGMWNQKCGKFPYKPGTPIFKCKDKECASNGGVIWEPKGAPKPTATPPKSAPRIAANVPDSQLPPFLRNVDAEETAELHTLIGLDPAKYGKALALYQGLAEFVNRDIAPIYEKSGVGASPEAIAACTNTLFLQLVKVA